MGLIIAIWIAVLAFGGTSPPFFFFVQVIIFGLGVLFLSANLCSTPTAPRFPWITSVFLVVLVLLQICPLPAVLAPLFGLPQHALASQTRYTLSIAPYQTVSHLLLLATYLTAFYSALAVCEDPRAKRRLVYALVALGAFEAFYGLVQSLTGWQKIFIYVKKYYEQDATGTYINRNHFAGFLEMVLSLTVALALCCASNLRRAVQRTELKSRTLLSATELLPLVFWVFLAVAIFTGIALSRSRMGIIAALASLITVLALAGRASLSKRTRLAAAVLFFLAVVGIVVWVGSDPLVLRFENLGKEFTQSGENRLSIWHDTLKLIQAHPLFGSGLGTFSIAYTSVQSVFLNLLVDHAHCDYLEVVGDLGLPGGILVFGSIFWIFISVARRYPSADHGFDQVICLGCVGGIAAILVHSLADFNLYIPANALVLSILLALGRNETVSNCGVGRGIG